MDPIAHHGRPRQQVPTERNKMPICCFLLILLFASFVMADGLTTQSSSYQESSKVSRPRYPEPCLALITEPDACDSDERMEETYTAIQRATKSFVNLVSIRLAPSNSDEVFLRAVELTKRLVALSSSIQSRKGASFQVVCSSDWVEAAVQGGAHGVHVKERHLSKIPSIRNSFAYDICIGTSTHSVESATSSFQQYQPDYYFVGTCFVTASHPEKSIQELEGPTLPGAVKRALQDALPFDTTWCPSVIAIGGIGQENCDVPLSYGADGVAVIRSVMQAKEPSVVVASMQQRMKSALNARSDAAVE